ETNKQRHPLPPNMDNLYYDPAIYNSIMMPGSTATTAAAAANTTTTTTTMTVDPTRASAHQQSEVLEGEDYLSVFNNDVGGGVPDHHNNHHHQEYASLAAHHAMYSPAGGLVHQAQGAQGGCSDGVGGVYDVGAGVAAMQQVYYAQQQQQQQQQLQFQLQLQQQHQHMQRQQQHMQRQHQQAKQLEDQMMQAYYHPSDYDQSIQPRPKQKSKSSSSSNRSSAKARKPPSTASPPPSLSVGFFPFVPLPAPLAPARKSLLAQMYPVMSKVLGCQNPALAVRRGNKTLMARECIKAMLQV
ncbi:hypothetical protein TrRE_jg4056, partial [Triparma retinervis]